ncbi:ferritin [Arthrobacter castelli]|uniref:ferritin n=1 Tax=Arthrobacter castelli TaxID=271431 RepID=UPI0004210741|nr:ferritin [Arthrobacter castelli]
MALTENLADAFDDQITLEFQASIIYRQLAIEMDVIDLPGIAAWFRAQAEEEIVHAEKFITHVTDRDGHPKIGGIQDPAITAGSALPAFEAALAHEQRVSESIRELYRLGQAEGDIDSIPLLNWFVNEQLEEEATVSEIISQVRMVHDDGPGLLRLDEQLGGRQSGLTE